MQMTTFGGSDVMPSLIVPSLAFAGNPFDSQTDITISSNTTWSDAIGFKKVRKLTINAGIVLTIAKSPFVIFADEINFGSTSSKINGDGPSGTGVQVSAAYARGGLFIAGSGGGAQGGSGGILLFVFARKISGAAGIISANGGNGWANSIVPNGNSNTANNGENALGIDPAGTTAVFLNGLSVSGTSNLQGIPMNLVNLLSPAATGGNTVGGSGIGGGGAGNAASPVNGGAAKAISVKELIMLYDAGCKGGGGGGVYVQSGATSFMAGAGGGGGAVVCAAKAFDVTPTLQANGGTADNHNTGAMAGAGGAGITLLYNL